MDRQAEKQYLRPHFPSTHLSSSGASLWLNPDGGKLTDRQTDRQLIDAISTSCQRAEWRSKGRGSGEPNGKYPAQLLLLGLSIQLLLFILGFC